MSLSENFSSVPAKLLVNHNMSLLFPASYWFRHPPGTRPDLTPKHGLYKRPRGKSRRPFRCWKLEAPKRYRKASTKWDLRVWSFWGLHGVAFWGIKHSKTTMSNSVIVRAGWIKTLEWDTQFLQTWRHTSCFFAPFFSSVNPPQNASLDCNQSDSSRSGPSSWHHLGMFFFFFFAPMYGDDLGIFDWVDRFTTSSGWKKGKKGPQNASLGRSHVPCTKRYCP